MRIERTYTMRQSGAEPLSERADFLIYCDETRFCEDAECEATHEDPSAKWDSRVNSIVATAYGRTNAENILAGLQARG